MVAALSLPVSIRSSVSAPTMPCAPRIELADLAAMLAGGLDDPAGGSVDDGGNAAGLGIKGVLRGLALHDVPAAFDRPQDSPSERARHSPVGGPTRPGAFDGGSRRG